MAEKEPQEARCQCCGGYAGQGRDPEYCGHCIRAGEPPEDWTHPAERESAELKGEPTYRGITNFVKLRGYEFEEVVPWEQLRDRPDPDD